MSSATKCPNCGLVSFATAETCKRCNAGLSEVSAKPPAPRVMPDEYVFDDVKERRGFSPLRVLLLILVVGGAIWFYCQYGAEKATSERAADEKKQQELMREHDLEKCGPGNMQCR